MNRGRFSIFGRDIVHIGGVDGEFDVPSTSVKRVRFLCDVTETAVTESAACEAAVRSEEERAKAIYDLRVESFLDNSPCSFSAVIRATRPKPIMGIAAKVRAIGHGSLVGAVAKVAKSEHSEVGVEGAVGKRYSACSGGILLTGSSSSVHHPLLTLSDYGSSARSYDLAKSEHGEVGGVVGSVRKRSSSCSVPRGILRSGSTCSSVAIIVDHSSYGGNTSGGSAIGGEAAGKSGTGVGGGHNKGVIWVPRYRKVLGLSLKDNVKSVGDSSSVRGGNPGGSSVPEVAPEAVVAEVSAEVVGGSDNEACGGNPKKDVVFVPRYRKVLGLSLKDYFDSGSACSSVAMSSDQSARGSNPGGSSAPEAEAVAEVSANVVVSPESAVVPKSFLSSGRGRW